jgi:hypothetical protein
VADCLALRVLYDVCVHASIVMLIWLCPRISMTTHLDHLAITRKTLTALTDRLPTQPTSPDLPEHPDYPRILSVFNQATGSLRARDVCEALDHELLPKNIEGTRAKLKRLVKLGILTEADSGNFTRQHQPSGA